MPSAREIEAGRAFVRLSLKNDFSRQLAGALKAGGAKLQGWGRSTMMAGAGMTAAGTAILAPLAAAVKSFASQGDQLDKMSQRTGIAASSLAELGFAAEQSGGSLEAVEGAVLKMNRRLGRITVGQGSGMQVAAVEELGLSVKQLNSMNPEERFLALADAMAGYGDNAAAAGLAQRAFGTGVDALIPLLTQGREGIAALRAEAGDLGIVPAQDEIDNAAKVTDAINRVKRAVKAMFFNIGAGLAGPALQFIGMLKTIAVSAGKFAKNKGAILAAAAAIGAALVVAGMALTAFGITLFAAGIALSTLGSVVGVLLSPLGLVVAAVIGATVAFFKWTESGQAVYKSLASSFGELLSWVREVFGAISNAMAAGDMQAAAEVMWSAIQVTWLKGLGWMRSQWADLRFFIVEMWGKAAFGILDTLSDLWTGMVDGFWAAADGIVDAWKWAEKSMAKGIAVVLAKLEGLDPNEVLANLEQDYGRQQAGRESGRAERDRANKEAADSRYAALKDAREEWSREAGAKRDAGIAGAESGLEDARIRLASAVAVAKALEVQAFAPGAGGGVGAGGVLAGGVLAGPGRGVGLTATYSAAAARISGYQPGGGPEEKMAAGIGGINENTKQMLVKTGELLGQGANELALFQQFLAGWRVG